MIINNKLRTLFVLALHIGFTIAIYAIVCHFLKIEFQDIHLLYAILVGCVAYLPRFIAEKKSKKARGRECCIIFLSAPAAPSLSFPIPDAPVRGQSPLRGALRSHVPPSKGGGG